MLYLLDTNVVSNFVRGVAEVEHRLSSLGSDDRVITCTVIVGEVLFGVGRLIPVAGEATWSGGRRKSCRCSPGEAIPSDAARHYADSKLALRQQGRTVGENDLWNTATALALSAVLVSRDRDVSGIANLSVEDWSK